ncbi:unnamed protein product, partial [Urochloa humidicola]
GTPSSSRRPTLPLPAAAGGLPRPHGRQPACRGTAGEQGRRGHAAVRGVVPAAHAAGARESRAAPRWRHAMGGLRVRVRVLHLPPRARVPCASRTCRLLRSPLCVATCSRRAAPPGPSCLNDTCGGLISSARASTSGNVITDVLSLPTTLGPAAPLGPPATAPAFLFSCGAKFL